MAPRTKLWEFGHTNAVKLPSRAPYLIRPQWATLTTCTIAHEIWYLQKSCSLCSRYPLQETWFFGCLYFAGSLDCHPLSEC